MNKCTKTLGGSTFDSYLSTECTQNPKQAITMNIVLIDVVFYLSNDLAICLLIQSFYIVVTAFLRIHRAGLA